MDYVFHKRWFDWLPYIVRNHYADFKGRAGRPEYWYSLLLEWIIILSGDTLTALTRGIPLLSFLISSTVFLFTVFLFAPMLAVTIRRLHDVNYSGWFLLVSIIPIIGFIWLLVLLASKPVSAENGNRF